MAEHLPYLPNVERLSPRVMRVLGGNPGQFTLQGSNTYIIGTGQLRILLDTGEGRDIWIKNIQDQLKREHAFISKAVITHAHKDHVGGIKHLLEIAPHIAIYKSQPQHGQLGIQDGQRFQVEGASLKAVSCPGHTKDHMAFILEEEDAIFTGDCILGHGTARFEDLPTYLASLEKLRSLCRGQIYPGHGPVIQDGPGKVLEYIKHRQERENQVLRVLSSVKLPPDSFTQSTELKDWTSMEIVKILYRSTADSLHFSAQKIVEEILRKLKKEGRVIETSSSERWRLNPIEYKKWSS